MKINVDSPMKQQEITELLKSQESPKYKNLGHPNNMATQIQFEVEEVPEGMDVIAYTKKLIKSQPYGSSIFFRVVEDGKFW
jgi:hypothetical protein